ncbi:MAG: single-stranded-DNA-specific exonuclease RecJ, partial [Sinobacterium sp.]|nr:single-stranded-DNA-specific exonuclease RecJ [Sinobacterium sp.]
MSVIKNIERRQVTLTPEHAEGLTAYPEFVRSILHSRGIVSDADLDTSLKQLIDPFQMMGMTAAVQRLLQALRQRQRLLIVGDFDADGATSTALLLRGFSALGFECVDYLLPDRFIFGYGLSSEIVD